MNKEEIIKKYQNDPLFHAIVSQIYNFSIRSGLTMEELDNAVTCVKYVWKNRKIYEHYYGGAL